MAQRSFGKDHPVPRLQIGADYTRHGPNCNATRRRGDACGYGKSLGQNNGLRGRTGPAMERAPVGIRDIHAEAEIVQIAGPERQWHEIPAGRYG